MASPVRAAATALLAVLGAFYIRLVYLTTRWTVEGYDAAGPALEGPGGVVLVTWHGRLFLAPVLAPKGKRSLAMVSRSRDGDLFAAILRRWGVGAVRGSTDDRAKRRPKGGGAAFSQALDALTGRGALVGLTPDGPRGPRHKARPGAARLAAAAQVPVVAAAFSANWGRFLRSWDRFLLPFPFGRGAIVYSAPRLPPQDRRPESLEQFTRQIEADLNAVTRRADLLCRRPA